TNTVGAMNSSVMEGSELGREESMLSDNMAVMRSTKKRLRDLVTAIAVCHNVRPVGPLIIV
ncbi:hypothetical protein SARC_17487, partial [Sphaeroforma arctica JP610]